MATIYGMTVTFGGGISGSTVPQVTVTAPTGSTVTAKKGDITLTTSEKNGVWVFDLPEFGAWVITATDGAHTATQSVVFEGAKAVSLFYFSATIAVTYPAGSTCTCTNGFTTLTAPDTSGSCTFIVTGRGTWTVACADGTNSATQDIFIENDGQEANAVLVYKPIASTAATDGVTYINGLSGLSAAEIALIGEAISNDSAIMKNTSTVYLDWGKNSRKVCVGDSVNISLAGSTYDFIIVGFNHDALTTPTAYGDATSTGMAGITLQMRACLSTAYTMNTSHTNAGGWDGCALRTAILPSIKETVDAAWRAVIKTVNKLTVSGRSSSTIKTSADELFLLSEIEANGSAYYSFAGEGSQYAYYAAGNSPKKTANGSACRYFFRSPNKTYNTHFCTYDSVSGAYSYNGAADAFYVPIALCI